MSSTQPTHCTPAGSGLFILVVTDVLALDRAIRWVTFEEAGHAPRWVSRDVANGRIWVGASSCGDELLDPLVLVLAERRDEIYGHGSVARPLRFLILAYDGLIQIAARCGSDSHINVVNVGIDPAADLYTLAAKLASLAAAWSYVE